MREIKFRAWDNRSKSWLMHTDRMGFALDGECMMFGEWNRVLGSFRLSELNELKITQYTGLKDKNGKEIYEGDIIHADYFGSLVIGYCAQCAAFVGCKENNFSDVDKIHNFHHDITVSNWEIIGNIHQHTHLIVTDLFN